MIFWQDKIVNFELNGFWKFGKIKKLKYFQNQIEHFGHFENLQNLVKTKFLMECNSVLIFKLPK